MLGQTTFSYLVGLHNNSAFHNKGISFQIGLCNDPYRDRGTFQRVLNYDQEKQGKH